MSHRCRAYVVTGANVASGYNCNNRFDPKRCEELYWHHHRLLELWCPAVRTKVRLNRNRFKISEWEGYQALKCLLSNIGRGPQIYLILKEWELGKTNSCRTVWDKLFCCVATFSPLQVQLKKSSILVDDLLTFRKKKKEIPHSLPVDCIPWTNLLKITLNA